MTEEKKALLQKYFEKSKEKCLSLRNWLQRMCKDDISLVDALDCIYDAADGKVTVMDDIITKLTDKKKLFGRTQYNTTERSSTNGMDLRRDVDGKIKLINYSSDIPTTLKGQHVAVNPAIVRKSDGQVNRRYINTERRLNDIGAWVRYQFPNAHVVHIAQLINSITKYAADHKISAERVCMLLDRGKLAFDSDDKVVQVRNESFNKSNRTVIITEEAAKMLAEESKMTEGRFNANMRFFIHSLLVDPVNAKVPVEFTQRGYTKSRLTQILLNNNLLIKIDRLSDTDENGEPKKATMMVKYKTPMEGFARKLKKLYIKMFERNVPQPMKAKEKISEDGEGCSMGATTADSSGQFISPAFPVQRRQIKTQEATTTTTVGDYQYTVPFPGDDETLARHDGVGGSVSINHKK